MLSANVAQELNLSMPTTQQYRLYQLRRTPVEMDQNPPAGGIVMMDPMTNIYLGTDYAASPSSAYCDPGLPVPFGNGFTHIYPPTRGFNGVGPFTNVPPWAQPVSMHQATKWGLP
jgi:hypothetical protein